MFNINNIKHPYTSSIFVEKNGSFPEKSGFVTFHRLWSPNFMPKIRKKSGYIVRTCDRKINWVYLRTPGYKERKTWERETERQRDTERHYIWLLFDYIWLYFLKVKKLDQVTILYGKKKFFEFFFLLFWTQNPKNGPKNGPICPKVENF